ncbi:protein kinase family protein [Piscirickettsia salmonis]|uniref:protein kinase family protein n=1 Tax=Piscirickettsia salmonis TaxID=1238 RepID=UPI0012BAAB83|nr:protein kinase family protein [Piscirickettsia salmonis]QGP40569.1 Protein kinase domain protein [Piscirickettsia salmonis]
MPSVIWYSKEQKAKEWSVANHLLANACNGTKIKRSHQKIPISYPDPSQPGSRVCLSHSFIKVGDKVFVMAGERDYLGEGVSGKVKLAEDEQDYLYVLKINHAHTSINKLEKNIAKDVNIFHGEAGRFSSQGAFKQVIALSYLGKDLEEIKKLNLKKKSTDYIGFLAVDEVLKLHKGELSAKGIKYIHVDLKLDNLSLAPDGKRVHLLDYGLSVPASNAAFGLRRAHEDVVINNRYPQYAPETRDGKCEFSYQSDIFSLGCAFMRLLADDSVLEPIARLMCDEEPTSRPSLELVKVAFLAEIYKHSTERLEQALVEYGCVITDPKFARKVFQAMLDPAQSSLFIQSINGLICSLHPRPLQTEDWQKLLESNHLQKVVIKLVCAEVNLQGKWQSILWNSNLQKAILSLESLDDNLTRDLQQLLENNNLQEAVAALYNVGVSLKKNYQCLLDTPSLQKVIIGLSHSDFYLARNLHDLLENNSFQQAVIILDQAGIDFKRSWNGLLWSTELQQVVIALGQAQVDLKANWQQLLSDPDLRKAVMVLANAGISLGGNWQQLLENASLQKVIVNLDDAGFNSAENLQQLLENRSLQKAAAVLDKVGIGLEGNAQELLANSNLQKALAAANDYLSYDFSRLGLSHGHHGKNQTKQFVRHLMAGEDKSECGVKMEMSRWIKGYGTFARSSSTQTLSRLDFACDSGLFPNSSATLFFAMSKVDREAMKQEVVSFSGK